MAQSRPSPGGDKFANVMLSRVTPQIQNDDGGKHVPHAADKPPSDASATAHLSELSCVGRIGHPQFPKLAFANKRGRSDPASKVL
jgi:hypothetical protein